MVKVFSVSLSMASTIVALGILANSCGLQGKEPAEPTKVNEESSTSTGRMGEPQQADTLADQTKKYPVEIELLSDSGDGLGLSEHEIKYLGTVVCLSGHSQDAIRDASSVRIPEDAEHCKFYFTHQLVVDGKSRDIGKLTGNSHENGASTSFDGITLSVISNYIATPSTSNSFIFRISVDE